MIYEEHECDREQLCHNFWADLIKYYYTPQILQAKVEQYQKQQLQPSHSQATSISSSSSHDRVGQQNVRLHDSMIECIYSMFPSSL